MGSHNPLLTSLQLGITHTTSRSTMFYRFLAVLSLWFPLTLTLVVCLLCISTILVSYCPTQNTKNSCPVSHANIPVFSPLTTLTMVVLGELLS